MGFAFGGMYYMVTNYVPTRVALATGDDHACISLLNIVITWLLIRINGLPALLRLHARRRCCLSARAVAQRARLMPIRALLPATRART
jgi:hypothetical protein